MKETAGENKSNQKPVCLSKGHNYGDSIRTTREKTIEVVKRVVMRMKYNTTSTIKQNTGRVNLLRGELVLLINWKYEKISIDPKTCW